MAVLLELAGRGAEKIDCYFSLVGILYSAACGLTYGVVGAHS